MTPKPARSRLATSLESLLDDTGLFTRAQWARFLGLSEAALSQWVHDKTLPRSDVLWAMMGVLQESDDIQSEPLDQFLALLDIPAFEISPHGSRLGSTLGQYLTETLVHLFVASLDGLSFGDRERILHLALDHARETRGGRSVSSGEGDATSSPATHSSFVERRMAGLASSVPGAPQLPEAHTPIIYPGSRVEPFLRTGRNALGLLDANGTRQELVGLFTEPGSVQVEGIPSCACMLWKIPPLEQRFASLLVDEMLFVLLSGEIQWTFEGSNTSASLRRDGDGPTLLWIPAATGELVPKGLPPFRVESHSDHAVGLAIFYRRDGLACDQGQHGQISMPSIAWSEANPSAYWNQMYMRLAHEGRTVPPLLGSITGARAAEDSKTLPTDADLTLYDRGIEAGQVSFQAITGWRTGPGAVLRPQIQRLYSGRPKELDDLWLVSHQGIKIVIPLEGELEAISIKPKPAETHLGASMAGRFGKDRWRVVRASAREGTGNYDDMVLLCSETWHGMRALGDRDATVLVISCAADHIGRVYSPPSGLGADLWTSPISILRS